MIDIGVAISTTGDEHRLALLERSVAAWSQALSEYGNGHGALFVTVDGDDAALDKVRSAVHEHTGSVFRVGQRRILSGERIALGPRLGVAANKNTGLELLMENTPAVDLFLSDDDSWPKSAEALVAHTNLGISHSMVCWGRHRRSTAHETYASWSWPRGSVLYATRNVIEQAGGMVEAFGPGGHEHVEWSQRIHNLGLTPDNYCTPRSYADSNFLGAQRLWHCEDMARPGEPVGSLISRRRHLTSIRRTPEDGLAIDKIMKEMKGSTAYVPYYASENGRAPATM